MGIISSISNTINGAKSAYSVYTTASSLWNQFTSLHLSSLALVIIAILLILFGGKLAKGITYLIAFVLIADKSDPA